MNRRCACGAPAGVSNVDITDVQCETCWWQWSHWCTANPTLPSDAWPGR